jgi:magnesium chelatase family protein
MNPCPCGYFGSKEKSCHCTSPQIQKYRNKISGPLLDRIELHVELAGIKTKELLSEAEPGESSAKIKERVEKTRAFQNARFKDEKIFFNSHMSHRHMKKFCSLNNDAKKSWKKPYNTFILAPELTIRSLK